MIKNLSGRLVEDLGQRLFRVVRPSGLLEIDGGFHNRGWHAAAGNPAEAGEGLIESVGKGQDAGLVDNIRQRLGRLRQRTMRRHDAEASDKAGGFRCLHHFGRRRIVRNFLAHWILVLVARQRSCLGASALDAFTRSALNLLQ
jgi:hypothetical protein